MKLRYALPALACCLLLAGCGSRTEAEAREFTLAEQGACTLSDGVPVDRWRLWHWGDDYYRLPDGTDLLWVREPMGPENVVNGQENVQDLNETARDAVLAWFEDRGLLYDVERELERAYALYLACLESGETYQNGRVEQTISTASSNERIICFRTSLTLPLDEAGVVEEIQLGTVFDRTTGEEISVWDLFTIPQAEVRAWVAEQASGGDAALRREMEAALEPEWIILEPEGLWVDFPQGTLPSQETACGWFEEYEKAPGTVLQPWAIPETGEEAG